MSHGRKAHLFLTVIMVMMMLVATSGMTALAAGFPADGRLIRKVAPCSGADSTTISPPSFLTMP